MVSLFTKIPLSDAVQSISNLLCDDETLVERTNIPGDEICWLVEMCLIATSFQFEDQLFEQVDGAAMGSPLSPIVANFYMKVLEKNELLWYKRLRYVDNTLVIWPHGESRLEEFHCHLNSQHPQIQFTKEMKSNNQISFWMSWLREMLAPMSLLCIGSGPIYTLLLTSPPHCEIWDNQMLGEESREGM